MSQDQPGVEEIGVPDPTVHVHVLPKGTHRPIQGAQGGYAVRDDSGATHERFPSRGEAVRRMSVMALRGAALPLMVLSPDGVPTGDRLA